MANNRISGSGQGLQYPQALYPTPLSSVPYTPATNQLALAPGQVKMIPAGDWIVYVGKYCTLQILDPILNVWTAFGTTQLRSQSIRSDGVNWRIGNFTGCPIGASITNGGSGYTSAPTVATATNSNGSTWIAVVGGAVNQSVSVPVGGGGSGYTVPPVVIVPAPPPGGVACTITATISGGIVTGYTVDNQGAGYVTAPVPVILTSAGDPNAGTIVAATPPTLSLSASVGQVTAVLCTNNGSAVAGVSTSPTLSFAGGGGTGAAATVNMCWMIASIAVSSGAGYANTSLVLADGGFAATGTVYANPIIEAGILAPTRPARGFMTSSGGTPSSANVAYDGGLFAGTPTVVALGGAPTTAVTLTPTLGSQYSEFYLQPL